MKEIFYFLLDLADYTALGFLLLYLFKDMVPERFGKDARRKTSALFFLQFVGVRMFLSYSDWAKQMIYGEGLYIADSRQSMIPVAIGMAATLLAGFVLYKGSCMKVLSLVTIYYAMWELVRFTLYPLAQGSIDFAVGYYGRLLWDEEKIGIEQYQRVMENIEIAWNLLNSAIIFAVLFFCIRRFKKYFLLTEITPGLRQKNFYRNREAALTFAPGLLGLVFTGMLRTILFYYDKEIYSIIEEYPELNLIIPVLSLLCLASVFLSARMLREMHMEHEMRLQAELYQSRTKELETHVRDMESVHIQIRGMKHDMKNYIADINALLARAASDDLEAKEQIRRYVDSIQSSLEELDIKYQTKNPVTDVILERYMRLAKQRNITFSSDFVYPNHLGIDTFDISVILNNGLENAFEACENEEEERFVGLYTRQNGRMFLLTVENGFTGALKWEEDFPVSAKKGTEHGLGLKNMKNCAEKYYGKIDVRADGSRFYMTAMLQGRTEIDDKK